MVRTTAPLALIIVVTAVLFAGTACGRDAGTASPSGSASSPAATTTAIYEEYPSAPTAAWGRGGMYFDPEASKPATQYTLIAVDVGATSPGPIEEFLHTHENAWRYCFWSALASRPLPEAELVAEMEVVDGSFGRIKVDASKVGAPEVGSCLEKELKLIGLGQSSERGSRSGTVRWTFLLGPG